MTARRDITCPRCWWRSQLLSSIKRYKHSNTQTQTSFWVLFVKPSKTQNLSRTYLVGIDLILAQQRMNTSLSRCLIKLINYNYSNAAVYILQRPKGDDHIDLHGFGCLSATQHSVLLQLIKAV